MEVLEKGLSIQVELKDFAWRSQVSAADDVKPFQVCPVYLRQNIGDELAQFRRGSDRGGYCAGEMSLGSEL